MDDGQGMVAALAGCSGRFSVTESIHQKAKELFAEVCDLPASECEKRLAECAASSPELVKEVRSLLAFHDGNSFSLLTRHLLRCVLAPRSALHFSHERGSGYATC